MQVSHTQKGRTLLEMMAVVSLIGLLVIGGTAGLRWGLARAQAIQLIKELGARAVLTETSAAFKAEQINHVFSVSGFANGRYTIIQRKLGHQAFSIHVSNISQLVCEQIEHVVSSSTATYVFINCASAANGGNFQGCGSPLNAAGTLCHEGTNALTLVFGNGEINDGPDGDGGFVPHDSNCPVVEKIPCGRRETYDFNGETCIRWQSDCDAPGYCSVLTDVCLCGKGFKWDSAEHNCVPATDCEQGYWDGENCQECLTDDHCPGGVCQNNHCQACSVGELCGSCQMETPWLPVWGNGSCICTSDETCEAYGYGKCGGAQCTEFCQAKSGSACASNDDCCDGYFCNMNESNDSCATPTTGKCQIIDMQFHNGWACSNKTTYSKYDAQNICAALHGSLLDEATARTSQIPIQTACRNLNAKAWTSTAFGAGEGSCWSYTMDCRKNTTGAAKDNATGFNVVCTGEGMWTCAQDKDCTSPTGAVCHQGTCECPANSYLQDGACITCDAEKHWVVNGEQNACTCATGYTQATQNEQATCCPNACSTKEDCCNGFECVAGACTQMTWKCNSQCTAGKYCKVNDSPAGNVDGACPAGAEISYTCATQGFSRDFHEGFKLGTNRLSWWDAWNLCDAAGLRLATVAEASANSKAVAQLTNGMAMYMWLADEYEDGHGQCKARFAMSGGYVVSQITDANDRRGNKTWGNDVNPTDGNRLHALCIKDPTEECTGNQAYAHNMTCRDCPEGSHPSEDRRTCVCEGGEGTFDKTNNKCTYTECEDGYKMDEETSQCVPDWKCNSLCDTTYQFCKVGSSPAGEGDVCVVPGQATQTCTRRYMYKASNGAMVFQVGSWYDAWNLCDSIGGHMPVSSEVTGSRRLDIVGAQAVAYHWMNHESDSYPCQALRFIVGETTYSAKWSTKATADHRIICIKDTTTECGPNQVYTDELDCQTCPDNSTKDPESDTCICANGETWERSTNLCLITECPPGKTLYAGKYCLESPWQCNELCPSGYYCRGHVTGTNNSVCPDGTDLNPRCVKLPKLSAPYQGVYAVHAGTPISWWDAWNMCDALGMKMLIDQTILQNNSATIKPLWNIGDRLWLGSSDINACTGRYGAYSTGWGTTSSYGKRGGNIYGAVCYKSGADCRDNQVVDNAGNCVTCPENSNKSGDTCVCNVLGTGTYNATTNTCAYEVCAAEAHLDNGQCVCNDGSAFNTETKQCVTTDCTTPATCGCAPNQYMNAAFQCIDCELGNEPDSTQTKQVRCTSVTQTCASCMAANQQKPYWNDVEQVCQACPSGQVMQNGSCKRCTTGQRANNEGTACVACTALGENRTAECPSCAFLNSNKPYWNSFLNKCTACTLENQIEENGACHACADGMELKSDGTCVCSNGVYNSTYHKCCPTTCTTSADCCAEDGMTCQAGLCSICTGNKVLHDGACVACPAGATAIKNATECQCPDRSVWNATTATCDACSDGYYSANNTCVECGIGYYLQGNECKKCTKDDAGFCEDKPCTTQAHCGGSGSNYYCDYPKPNNDSPGTGKCTQVGSYTTDWLPNGTRVWFSANTADYWSARNWCEAIGRQPYECKDPFTESGHDCTNGIQLNKTCPELVGYTFPHPVYLQTFSCSYANYTCAYYTGSTLGATGGFCGGWAKNRDGKKAFCK